VVVNGAKNGPRLRPGKRGAGETPICGLRRTSRIARSLMLGFFLQDPRDGRERTWSRRPKSKAMDVSNRLLN